MDYGKVLGRAWQIIWKNKVLWLFGILASCSNGGGSGGSSFNSSSNFQTDSGDIGNLPPQVERFFRQMSAYFDRITEDQIILYVLIFCAFILAIALLFWFISIFGRTALVKGTLDAEAGQTLGFRSLWKATSPYYRRALGLNFLLSLIPFTVVLLLVGLGILAGVVTAGIGLICLVPIFCLMVPLFIAYSVYVEIANVSLVTEDLDVSTAISRGWAVFRNNLGSMAIMGLLLYFGIFIVSLLVSLPFIAASLPFMFSLMSGSEEAFNTSFIIYLACFAVGLPLFILFNGILQAYLHTAWTLTYGQLSGPKRAAVAKIASSPKPSAPRRSTTTRRKTSR